MDPSSIKVSTASISRESGFDWFFPDNKCPIGTTIDAGQQITVKPTQLLNSARVRQKFKWEDWEILRKVQILRRVISTCSVDAIRK